MGLIRPCTALSSRLKMQDGICPLFSPSPLWGGPGRGGKINLAITCSGAALSQRRKRRPVGRINCGHLSDGEGEAAGDGGHMIDLVQR